MISEQPILNLNKADCLALFHGDDDIVFHIAAHCNTITCDIYIVSINPICPAFRFEVHVILSLLGLVEYCFVPFYASAEPITLLSPARSLYR
jgi:hypothetical protein